MTPVLILAQPKENSEKERGFCARLSSISSKTGQRLADRDAKLEEKRNQIENRINEHRSGRNTRLEEKRIKWDTNRAEHFSMLEEKAQTDEGKQAVFIFIETISAAIAVRRAAVDRAIQNFREGIENIKASRMVSADTAISAFRNSIGTAYESAQSECDNGEDQSTIRQNLRNQLRTARQNFVEAKQEIGNQKTQMETLITTKREATKAAIDEFKAILEQARADFKAAVGTTE